MAMSSDQVAYQTAHIHEDKRINIIAATATLSVLSTLAILLRIVVRVKTRAGFQTDDYTIFAAGVSVNQTRFGLDPDLETDRSLAQLCMPVPRCISPSSFSREGCSWLMVTEARNGLGLHLIAVSEHQLANIFKVRTGTKEI